MSEYAQLISTYGPWAVAGIIALESMGLPLPGEAILIAAAILAGTMDILSIWSVLSTAVAGAIMGSMLGYWIGWKFGSSALAKYGRHVCLTESRIKIGRYLIIRYGGKLVFAARFVPVMRNLAGLLAGANHMRWGRFMLANSTSAAAWVTLYGISAYYLGEQSMMLASPVLVAIGFFLLLITIGLAALAMRYENNSRLPL